MDITVLHNTTARGNMPRTPRLGSAKDIEAKINDRLYETLKRLNMCHPPRPEFLAVLKKDMFVKNNKAAFFEVVYYLLNVLDPVKTKECLQNWPPCTPQRESKFRNELFKLTMSLNETYKDADVPSMMASHFITPGGIRIAKFVYKISQLVLFEHLKRDEKYQSILYRLSPNTNEAITEIIKKNVVKVTNNIKMKTSDMLNDFNNFFKEAQNKTKDIILEQNEVRKDIAESKQNYAKVQSDFNANHPQCPSEEEIASKLKKLAKKTDLQMSLASKFQEMDQLRLSILSNNRVLEHNPEKLKLPQQMAHLANKEEQLDLKEYFNGLEVVLNENALNLKPHTAFQLRRIHDEVTVVNEELEKVMKRNLDTIVQLENFNKKLN